MRVRSASWLARNKSIYPYQSMYDTYWYPPIVSLARTLSHSDYARNQKEAFFDNAPFILINVVNCGSPSSDPQQAALYNRFPQS
ncbi:Uncharacterized protein HZ326_6089 [Fusarium oxysporum f. sp. albedinis]|nr:Uncharacterized protein HZ326_6089 [Fusarium oxysporum f. sp. albedinis]